MLPVETGVSTADGRNRRVSEAARILEAFFVYHVGRELRSLRVMRAVLGDRRKGRGHREGSEGEGGKTGGENVIG
jgi:hypothetical protein